VESWRRCVWFSRVEVERGRKREVKNEELEWLIEVVWQIACGVYVYLSNFLSPPLPLYTAIVAVKMAV